MTTYDHYQQLEMDAYDHDMNKWYEYEFKEYFVQCECGATETATQKNLEAFGWHLSKTEYCPKCSAQIRALKMTPEQYEQKCIDADVKPRVRECETCGHSASLHPKHECSKCNCVGFVDHLTRLSDSYQWF